MLTTGLSVGLTDLQEAELQTLYETEAGLALSKSGSPLKWTDNKRVRMGELIAKRDAKPVLSKSGQTICDDWIIAMLFDQFKDYENKYTKKGNMNEKEGVKLTKDFMKREFMIPYEGERMYDKDLTGICDVLEPDIGVDIKNPYWAFSHPVIKSEMTNKIYEDQGVVYCELFDRPWWCFSYTLTSAPQEIIEKEATYEARKLGYMTYTDEIYEAVERRLTYEGEPMEKRIRLFWVKRDNKRVELIRTAVGLCREYIHDKLIELSETQSIYPPDHKLSNLTALQGDKLQVA